MNFSKSGQAYKNVPRLCYGASKEVGIHYKRGDRSRQPSSLHEPSQTGMVVLDAIRLVLETRAKERKELRERRESAEKLLPFGKQGQPLLRHHHLNGLVVLMLGGMMHGAWF